MGNCCSEEKSIMSENNQSSRFFDVVGWNSVESEPGVLMLNWKNFTHLPTSLFRAIQEGKVSSPTILILDFNKIEKITQEISQLTNLTELSIAGNALSEISDELWQVTALTTLNLGGNQLKGEIPVSVQNLFQLKHLYFQDNKFDSLNEAFSLRKLSHLERLNISFNAIDTKYKFFELNEESEIRDVKDTSHLVMNSNFPFPPSLKVLLWSGNNVTFIPPSIPLNLPLLTELDFSENSISTIPKELLSLQFLEKLFLECNSISEIPSGISSKWLNLNLLDLSYNFFIEIPQEVLQLPKLSKLDVIGNPLKTQLHADRNSRLQIDSEFPVPDEILPKLYLGDWSCARNKTALSQLGITHVLCVAEFRALYPNLFQYKIINIADTNSENLFQYFPTCIEYIEEALKTGAILVHCKAGVSRSAAVVIAYLIKNKRMNVNEAFSFVKRKRSRIDPNAGFIKQLQEWHEELLAKG